jgi:CheY-like chemotaxis protein
MSCAQVVIIEDDQDIRNAMAEALREEGYFTLAFANGREAVDGLQDYHKPCLILLDLMMPIMNGWEFLQARRSLGDTIVAAPVFIVSAIASPAEVKRADVQGYVKKPVDLDILLRVVRAHCGVAGAESGEAAEAA